MTAIGTHHGSFVRPLQGTGLRTVFLACGVLSSLLYLAANIIVPLHYEGYSVASQTVSELSAIDAPTRSLWLLLVTPYSVLVIAFGAGVWLTAEGSRALRTVGALLVADGVLGFFWPPMHMREVLAAGGGTLSDTLHIAFAAVTVIMMMLIIGFGAAAFDRRFRLYSVATLVTLFAFGVLTGIDGPLVGKNLPTPLVGVWERINIGVYMLWIVVLAILLLRGAAPRRTRIAVHGGVS